MSNPVDTVNVTSDKLRRLAALVRKNSPQQAPVPDASECNWNQPRYFSSVQMEKLRQFAEKAALRMIFSMKNICPAAFEPVSVSLSQHYFLQSDKSMSDERIDSLYLPFTGAGKNICGFVCVQPDAARQLTGLVLGDAGANLQDKRKLSPLEKAVLMDVLAPAAGAFFTHLAENNGPSLQKSSAFVTGDWPLKGCIHDAMLTFDFAFKSQSAELCISITVLSSTLDPVAGITPAREYSPDELSMAMMQNLNKAMVDVKVQLCSAAMAMKDIMGLAEGDVLLLDKKITDPIQVLCNSRPCFSGFAVALKGRYAVRIAGQAVQN